MATDQSVIKIAQELLSNEPVSSISAALISEKIDMVLAMNPRWSDGFDREKATAELIRRFSMWIGKDTALSNMAGHEAWLDAARKQNWRYWQRYREWSERKLSANALDALDISTDRVLGLLEDPRRDGGWDRRGLVVGHVQSGKTGNYSGLISKAADAGYKIIIVLAGLHNNLRSQTQVRLDEAFLGYETAPNAKELRTIGVGLIDGDSAIRPNFATNRTNGGDFNSAIASKLGITPEQRPWLFVIKKNKTVLTRLLEWIRNHVADATEAGTGRRIVSNLPLLVIDDEADHASVDTGLQEFDENGQPDVEYEPKAINSLIRQILHSFEKKAYVGYTATPFANIFIHENGRTAEEGDDLFPAAFIINLGAPSNYIGPSQIFGVKTTEGRTSGLPLVRTVDDHSDWMPQSHKRSHRPETSDPSSLPPSLREAIHSFLLATAVRYLRGQRAEHSSMLIHVTRFNDVQDLVHKSISEYMRQLRQRLVRGIGGEAVEADLARLWAEDFIASGRLVRERLGEAEVAAYPDWQDVRNMLADVCADVEVRMINGSAKDALDYTDNATGLKVIAIGGDKLSRGLTLEGLVTSYFLRASKMYDTLMQMGRWFGYRPGYLDVCRLYTTSDLQEWFGHIADAAAELREEFEMMAASGATPREYGLKVQSHPVLMVTSRLKMRTAETLLLSFSGSIIETVSLYRDNDNLLHNRNVTEKFLSGLAAPGPIPPKTFGGSTRNWSGHVWSDIPGNSVADFLSSYRTHPSAYKANSPLIADFIRKMNVTGGLTSWTVALLGGGAGEGVTLAPGATVKGIKRFADDPGGISYSIGRLVSPRDETLDLDEDAWQAALKLTQEAYTRDPEGSRAKSLPEDPNGPSIRRIKGKGAQGVAPHPERGLLLLYVIDPALSGIEASLPVVIGFAAAFPDSDAGVKVQYKVNNVFLETEYNAGG